MAFVTELKAEEKNILDEIKPIDPKFKVDVVSCEPSKIIG